MTRLPTAAALLMLAALPALGQPVELPMPAVEAPAAPPGPIGLTAAQLDQLVAPVALYPDPLLTDVLAASTYPAQVVEAQRFVTDPANAGLAGAALTDKAASHGWDASVQALLPFPQVLQMMDSNLEWTDRLGRAVMAQQADVMNAVQRLRQRAEAAGALRNGPQDTLVNDGDTIAINPPSPQEVFLPAYDAACVYGPDPACAGAGDAVGWDDAVFLPYGYWQWGLVDWGHRRINLDRAGAFGRGGVGYDRGPGWGGDVWRHEGSHSGLRMEALNGVRFNYAPPAGTRLSHGGFPPQALTPARFGTAAGFHGAVGRGPGAAGPVAHAGPAIVAHGGGFGGAGHR